MFSEDVKKHFFILMFPALSRIGVTIEPYNINFGHIPQKVSIVKKVSKHK